MQTIGAIVAAIHNAWAQVPAWLQAGILAIVVALFTLAAGFGWTVPHSLSEAQAEFMAFVVLAVPTVVGIFRKSILPYIVDWFLTYFGYQGADDFVEYNTTGKWVKI
jgi:hypothetical protein